MAFNIVRVMSLPPQPEPDTMYLVKEGEKLGIAVTGTSTTGSETNDTGGSQTTTDQPGNSE